MQNELYIISNWQQTEQNITCNVQYDATHPIFEGHFPGQPVVPGVCTMEMVKEMLQRAIGQKLLLRSTGQVKFLQLILPDVTPEVSISWQLSGNTYSVTASLKAADAFLFKMNGTYEPYHTQ